MGLDALLKRCFPAVVLVLIGVAGYFQASGFSHLAAAWVTVDPSTGPAPVKASQHHAQQPPDDRAAAVHAILSRNPFDSVTGSLLGDKPVPQPDAQVEPGGDERACETVRVVLIAWSEEPAWSFASIAGRDGRGTLRREGDDVDGYKIESIEWDRVRMTSPDGRGCQMVMGEKAVAAISVTKDLPIPVRTMPPRRDDVPPAIAAGIHQVGEGHFTVERSVIGQVMQEQAKLFGSVRATAPGDGKGGMRLVGIRPGSLLGSLGVRSGDRIQTINGFDVGNPKNAMEAYQRLLKADHLTVAIDRNGSPSNIDIDIQ